MPDTGKERRQVWILREDLDEEHEAALAKARKEAVEEERNRRVGKIIQNREALRKELRKEGREEVLTALRVEAEKRRFCNKCFYIGPLEQHPGCDYLAAADLSLLDSLTKED